MIINFINGIGTPSPGSDLFNRADIDDDGKITFVDGDIILKMALGSIQYGQSYNKYIQYNFGELIS